MFNKRTIELLTIEVFEKELPSFIFKCNGGISQQVHQQQQTHTLKENVFNFFHYLGMVFSILCTQL